MSLRRRIALTAGIAVAVAICAAAAVSYLAVRGELRGQVDDSLRRMADIAEAREAAVPPPAGGPPIEASILRRIEDPEDDSGALGPVPFIQRIEPGGATITVGPDERMGIPVAGPERAIAVAGEGRELRDEEVDGTHLRVLTVGTGESGAIQIAQSLEGVDDVLANLRVVLVIVVLAGTALAALLARRFATSAIAPITELTETTERIAETEDLSRRIEVGREDEVGRLAERFNAMLATLERSQTDLANSVSAQRQLVADASHELRTPIASLRTDIEVLVSEPDVPEAERRRMLGDIDDRIAELGALVGDVIELARGDEPAGEVEDVRLDLLVAEAVERARRHWPERRFEVALEPSVVEARRDRLGRAIGNLLDNAVKFSPDGSPVEVSVADGAVVVRDHGPGIPKVELPHVFDRFYRGASVREVPGSGLGLAIVRQVAEAHGGSVEAENVPEGGAVFRMLLPAASDA